MVVAVLGFVIIVAILWDAFESIILPRRVSRRLRLTRGFYRATWVPFRALAGRIHKSKRRETVIAMFGPLSLLLLLVFWAFGLITGFAVIQWGLGSPLSVPEAVRGQGTFGTYLYASGETFFTLGYGDITPLAALGRALSVCEAGIGFGFLAVVIGYLPVFYQSFSRREINISLLDARAGSPPSASELLRRHGDGKRMDELPQLLREWERWSAELLESHLSYPLLSFFRSQHSNQSWLAALTTILDACALVLVGLRDVPKWQARLTFAIARHAVVDLAQILNAQPHMPQPDRLPPGEFERVRAVLVAGEVPFDDAASAEQRLKELRLMYEPHVNALAAYLLISLPPWAKAPEAVDNWQTSAQGRIQLPLTATPMVEALGKTDGASAVKEHAW